MTSQPDDPQSQRPPRPSATTPTTRTRLQGIQATCENNTTASTATPTSSLSPTQQPTSEPDRRPQLHGQPPSVAAAFKSIKPGDFLTVHETPCARQGILTGIGAGAAVGALRVILKSSVPKAANWAVGGFVLGSLVQYEVCQWRRRAERSRMKRAVEVHELKMAEAQTRRAELARERPNISAAPAAEEKGGGSGAGPAGDYSRSWKSWIRFW